MTASRPSALRLPVLAALLAAGSLSACSAGGSGPTAAATSAGAATSAAATTPAPATTPAAGTTASAADGGTAVGAAGATSSVPQTLPADTRPAATDSPRPTETDVVLTFVGWNATTSAVEAGGYVSPVVESGGTCTLELSRAGTTVTVKSPARPDASTTACGGLSAGRSRLTPGSWVAVLRYSSQTSTGSSERVKVEVPT